MSNEKNTKNGFTIIEVVLVLAIAGLIFLMVFVALPQLQKSQRDTQRRSDLARVATAITQYQANNKGKVPTPTGGGSYATVSCTGSDVQNLNPKTYNGSNIACKFIAKYMNSSSSTTNEFIDPDGTTYSLNIEKYSNAGGVNTTNFGDHTIAIRISAKCDGGGEENYTVTSRPNDYAILYKLEGSGIYCIDNQ